METKQKKRENVKEKNKGKEKTKTATEGRSKGGKNNKAGKTLENNIPYSTKKKIKRKSKPEGITKTI